VEDLVNTSARRKWALENAACALVVFGTIAAVLLFDSGSVRAQSTTGTTDLHEVRPALTPWSPVRGSNPVEFAASN
jgi:hypothetical protein